MGTFANLLQDGLIHQDEFALALFKTQGQSNIFTDKVFQVFDIKRNDVIDFEEFVKSLSVFHPKAPLEEKAQCAWLEAAICACMRLQHNSSNARSATQHASGATRGCRQIHPEYVQLSAFCGLLVCSKSACSLCDKSAVPICLHRYVTGRIRYMLRRVRG